MKRTGNDLRNREAGHPRRCSRVGASSVGNFGDNFVPDVCRFEAVPIHDSRERSRGNSNDISK